jgi:hypothetical protein
MPFDPTIGQMNSAITKDMYARQEQERQARIAKRQKQLAKGQKAPNKKAARVKNIPDLRRTPVDRPTGGYEGQRFSSVHVTRRDEFDGGQSK